MKNRPHIIPPVVNVAKRYGYWAELLHEWLFLAERVNRLTKGKQAVYAHKERTNVSLFAAAATASGWAALVECRASKTSKTPTDDPYQGRTDLMLWRGRRFHEIEAKFLRVPLTSRVREKRLDKASERALNDAARATQALKKSDRTLAMTFVVPTLSTDEYKATNVEDLASLLHDFVRLIIDKKPEFYAYAFPEGVHAVGTNDRSALGVIIFGNEPSEA